MASTSAPASCIGSKLKNVADELRQIETLLSGGAELDSSLLTDFRDAVNRVRTTAWAMQQYAESKMIEGNPQAVLSRITGERIRVAYQMCRLIQSDLARSDLHFQKGQLDQLRVAAQELAAKLAHVIQR